MQVILYQNDDALVLYDYRNQVVLSEKDFPRKYATLSYGKTVDPHVIYSKSVFFGSSYFLAYVDGSEVKLREVVNYNYGTAFHQSRLDFGNNEWSYISSDQVDDFSGNNESSIYILPAQKRKALTHRFSDMLVVSNVDLPDDAKLKRSRHHVFALYPSELGYAEKIDISRDYTESLKNFNIPFIDEDVVRMSEGS